MIHLRETLQCHGPSFANDEGFYLFTRLIFVLLSGKDIHIVIVFVNGS